MITHAITCSPSRIDVLSDVLLSHQESKYSTDQEISESIINIWLPIFRSRQNLSLALNALKISYAGEATSDLCARYLAVLEVLP
jgi:hypothetical protein